MVLERSGLTTQKIKEKLSVRKLITPLEMREFEGAAARVGTMSAAGRKWNANKEQLESVKCIVGLGTDDRPIGRRKPPVDMSITNYTYHDYVQ